MPANLQKNTWSSLAIALLLSGCAMAPPAPKTFAGLGHFEQYQLNTAIFRVRFSADANLSPASAEEITLLKAAKTTLDAGYRFFTVLDQSKPSNARQTVVYSDDVYGSYGLYGSRWPYNNSRYGFNGYSGYGRSWGVNDPFYNPFYEPPYSRVAYNLDPIEVTYTIKCSNSPSQKAEEFDARLILASLGPKYYLNSDGTPRAIHQEVKKTNAAKP